MGMAVPMSIHDAIDRACADVGIARPRETCEGAWVRTDTFSRRNGKGDGSVKVNGDVVFAKNFQTGELAAVRIDNGRPVDRAEVARSMRRQRDDRRKHAERAAGIAAELCRRAGLGLHRYLAAKGFGSERAMIIGAEDVRAIGGDYLVVEGAQSAVVVPARIGARLTSVQLIWDAGQKRFLAGGEMGGAAHRLARGRDTWLCEGFATGLSLRAVLRSLNRSDGVLCCFSASNLPPVSRTITGRCWIAADCDKPMPQFGGLGTGEHYARAAGRSYAMPAKVGQDLNDLHLEAGIYAVQRLLGEVIRKGMPA